MQRQLSLFLTLSCLLLTFSGCGGASGEDQPEVATVEGVVLVDGFPMQNLQVTFTPEEGRPSQGVTDLSGHYSLSYIGATQGAKLGQHKVQITTLNVSTSDRIEEQVPFKETIPEEFNTKSELTVFVSSGENTHDFNITTKKK